MTNVKIIRYEHGVMQSMRVNHGVEEHVMADIFNAFGDEIRESVQLGYPCDAIANEYVHRWAARK